MIRKLNLGQLIFTKLEKASFTVYCHKSKGSRVGGCLEKSEIVLNPKDPVFLFFNEPMNVASTVWARV